MEWIVEGGGLDGYYGEHTLAVGIQGCLDYALTISAGSFFQNGTIRMVGAHWGRLWVKLVSVPA